jgi:anti-repressor protein
MSNIIPFNYESKEVRVIKDNEGNPWWIASDVCEIIGLSNTTEALRNLDDDEKSTLRISEGGPERNIINEPGLYSLIIRSNKPEAKKFKRWITHEVLPSIRKTGGYEVDTLSEIDLIIKSAQALICGDN